MDINEGTTTEDLWTPFKELVAVVESHLTQEKGAPYAVHTFESLLRRHKQTFLSLFKHPAKNNNSREEIKRGITEGVNLPSIGRTLLAKELVDEAIIISDMYNVNEYLALELLHSAQRQCPRHPGLGRGLVAIILYYDGRRALVQALKELVMARDGISWSIGARDEIVKYVSRYVDQLLADGLLGNILDALQKFTLTTELELLQNNRALPPPRHHHRLLNTIDNTRKLMAGIVFAASAQRGLERDILLRLINEQSKPSHGPTGALDDISLALHMALLYALDLSVLHRREDGEELAKKLPLIQDPELISVLLDELSPPVNQMQESQEKYSGVRALCQLSLGLALAALKRAPQSLMRSAPGGELKCEILDQDEMLVDAAIDGKVFEYLDEAILSSDNVCKEEFYQRRLHSLITDFIVLMHSKLMEMRVKADEAARALQMYAAEGIAPPAAAAQSRTRLDSLLRCVERLYATDPLGLRNEYWSACDTHPHSYRSSCRSPTLYKFVRLSGELVCASLLPPYLRALTSLTVPKHTWALLARRDALSANHLLSALNAYCRNLRVDATPFPETMHSSLGASALVTPAARPGKLLVRQEEVEAMIAALKLIAAVSRAEPAAAAAICENSQWDALNCMCGLVCCHIPIQLKAELLYTLAALGSTPTTAGRVWAAIEAAQLVSATKERRGLNAELLEVESRMEQYPLSVAFLSLLEELCSSAPLPRTLGAGARSPGLDPYVDHVINKLALPAPHRPYTDKKDSYQILALCFKVLSRWLSQYEPSAADFQLLGPRADMNPPPGLRVLLLLSTKSELLHLLFNTLQQASELLDRVAVSVRRHLELCTIHILEMLERALSVERALLTNQAEAGHSPPLVGLAKLIVAPEGTNKVSCLTVTCALVQHGVMFPQVGARAVALLCRALQSPSSASHLLHECDPHARHGFVECLEAEEPEGQDGVAARQAKEGIVVLIQQLLPTAPPNFAHFLLGYQLTEHVSRSAISDAGVGGYPRTCLHSILDILDQHITRHNNPDREASNLVESCYRLLYWVCARPATSGPALRYLRAREYFLARHLKATVNLETASVATISSRSWVLRTCACEVGAGAAAGHAPALAALLPPRRYQEWDNCLLRRSLEGLSVSVEPAVEPRWEVFHQHQLRETINACDLPTGLGGKRVSVSRLHAVLQRELASLHAAAPQRNLVALEIQKVLDYVTEVNRQRNLAATLTHYYDSWRQLTEIIFCVAPDDLFDLETKKNLLLNILQDLLNKIPPAEVLPQVGNLASGTVLLLQVNLRHCYILQKRESSLKSIDFETTFFGPSTQIMQTKSLTLKFILHKILSWILVSSGSTQKMRVNLYGALLNFLNIVNLKHSPAEPEENRETTYVSRLDSSKARPDREESSLKAMVIDVISSFGDNLCSIVCGDCISAGHDVCRMVALSCLDTLIEINPRTDWMNTLTNQGYLRSLIDSLMQDDEGLKQALEASPKSLRVLYVYESKMALLIKIASTRVGAETVLAQGALSGLANMSVLTCHPDIHAGYSGQTNEFLPSVADRFRQILVPAMALCDAVLTTLGTDNHSCVTHVLNLILSHSETADAILRSAHPNSSEGLLIELEALTSVIGRASNHYVIEAIEQSVEAGINNSGLQRLQSLTLALLARFRQITPNHKTAALCCKILCNVLTYTRNITATGSPRLLLNHSLLGGDSEGPGCGVAVELLQSLVHLHQHYDKLLVTTTHQMQNLPTMSLDDMKKLLGDESSQLSPAAVRVRSAATLAARVRERRGELVRCSYAVQSALHLAWAQLRVCLRASIAVEKPGQQGMSKAAAILGAAPPPADMRRALVCVFNDRFTELLRDTAKNHPQAQRSFIEVLVKDIKTMIQFSPY